MKLKKYNLNACVLPLFSLFLALATFLFWYVAYPHALSYQEQNQLFLWSWDYFCADISQMGGLADWLGEFVVQFYYHAWLGAALLAIVFAAMFCEIFMLLKFSSRQVISNLSIAFASVVPCLLLILYLSDENVLMSYVMGILCSVGLALILRKLPFVSDVVLVPMFYWLLGPISWLYVILRYALRGEWKQCLFMALYLVAIQAVASYALLTQWSLLISLCGLNYYRIPLEVPALQIVIPLAIVAIAMIVKIKMPKVKEYMRIAACILVLMPLLFCIYKSYDTDKYELIRQDYLIRNERWQEIIDRAGQHELHNSFSSNAVNLALAMTGQLANMMFSFYQSGGDALVMPMVRDNTSNLPTMEAFFRLGMVSESMRYAFDLQESILNGKKSGRLMKRISECCIINGRYKTAEKYLDILSKSLFYREWAERAKSYLGQEQWIDTHDVWGHIRAVRYKSDFLYNYGERDKMFGILVMENNKNKMALEYFLGQLLLNGDVNAFMQYLPLAQQYGNYKAVPYGYQDAWNCIQAHGQLNGSPYASYVKRMTASKEADGATGASLLMK